MVIILNKNEVDAVHKLKMAKPEVAEFIKLFENLHQAELPNGDMFVSIPERFLVDYPKIHNAFWEYIGKPIIDNHFNVDNLGKLADMFPEVWIYQDELYKDLTSSKLRIKNRKFIDNSGELADTFIDDFMAEYTTPKENLCNTGYIIERCAIYDGFLSFVVFNETGYRQGYVTIPCDHALYEANSSDNFINFQIHGGVDYSRFSPELVMSAINVFNRRNKIQIDPNKQSTWAIGFSCGHFGDAVDYEKLKKWFPESEYIKLNCQSGRHGMIRSAEYVDRQCKILAYQLAKFK